LTISRRRGENDAEITVKTDDQGGYAPLLDEQDG
jgi:hypothetical protein